MSELQQDACEQALDTRRVRRRSLYVDAWHRLLKNRAAVGALVVLALMVLLVTFGPMLTGWDHEIPDWDAYSTPPSLDSGHYFGTDALGRDLFVRILLGGRISLLAGLAAPPVSRIMRVAWGAFAGCACGRTGTLPRRCVC